MSDDKINLATGDKELLRVAATGEGGVEVTPDLMKEIGKALDARKADIEARYPALVEACPYETRLAVAAWVFEAIVKHATEGGSFRFLIYDRLGFGPNAYVPLYMAGGMTISNEFDLSGADSDKAKDAVSEPAKALPAAIIRVKIEEGGTGLLYATSPDLHGLLVAERDMDALDKAIPRAITDLYAAQDIKVAVVRATGADAPFAWVAIPAEIAHRLGAQ